MNWCVFLKSFYLRDTFHHSQQWQACKPFGRARQTDCQLNDITRQSSVSIWSDRFTATDIYVLILMGETWIVHHRARANRIYVKYELVS